MCFHSTEMESIDSGRHFLINISYRPALEWYFQDEDYVPLYLGAYVVEEVTLREREREKEKKGRGKHKRSKSIIVMKKLVYGKVTPNILALECGTQCVRKETGGY